MDFMNATEYENFFKAVADFLKICFMYYVAPRIFVNSIIISYNIIKVLISQSSYLQEPKI